MIKKQKYVYCLISILILAITALTIYFGVIIQWSKQKESHNEIFAKVLLIWNCLITIIFTCASVPRSILIIFYWLTRPRIKKNNLALSKFKKITKRANVAYCYCTCDDFDEYSLKKSMKQNYENYKIFILDDSEQENNRKKIDEFSKEFGVEVIRRKNRIGYKAGNLNNFLETNMWWDYFVILDADEIIVKNFIGTCLPLFENDPKLSYIQANHRATRPKNLFTKYMSLGVHPQTTAQETARTYYGVTLIAGHGCMISRESYMDIGGFREDTINEDISFSIMAKEKGWNSIFLEQTVCEEEFPVNFVSFKKRQARWWKGTTELIKRGLLMNVFRIKTSWIEKADSFLIVNSTFVNGLSGIVSFINIIIISLLNMNISLLFFMIPISIILTIAPLVSDLILIVKRKPIIQAIIYMLFTWLAYTATSYVFLKGFFRLMTGGENDIYTNNQKKSNIHSLTMYLG